MLVEENRKSKKRGLRKTEAAREALKEERRKLQVNNVKYDNCKIYDSEGRHIFNCNEKKAQWYLRKGYGDLINDNPIIV